MEPTTVIRQEAQRLAHVLAATDPAAPVPTCPAWTAGDLLWHLTEVHEFWSRILATGALTDEDAEALEGAGAPRPADLPELLRRREAATAQLVEQLERRADAEPAWSWDRTAQDVGFTRRMQTHEATMHRVDAELAAQRPVTDPTPQIAAAGIAHGIDVMWGVEHRWASGQRAVTPVALVVLRRPDGTEDHLELSRLEARPGGEEPDEYAGHITARRAPAQDLRGTSALSELPRAVVDGSAPALYLWCWGRSPALEALASGRQEVRISGDAEAREALEKLLAQGLS
ncbi:maleylpyruvate isomerase N-terminal domain-containing protein [Brachybacterium hainanense]|uniref:Maleylpyruvate isomerase N-terminal domain-containing protein n=1 Tax=Brachybacterium hainanense TaxID=1541174 RepID=A0ABV6RGH7_9MICO